MDTKEFDDIRPYNDEELPQVYEELIADEAFRTAIKYAIPDVPFETVASKMRTCKTKLEFQKAFCYGFLHRVMAQSTKGATIDISEIKDKKQAHTYISNHRDIVLDSGFLDILLVDEGLDTVEIAIGDNLLIYPWIKKFVRVNKSFIVQRGLTMRQILEASSLLSRYMHYAIADKRQSIWIAQREGRAKDSNDRTQDSVLKMLSMGGTNNIIESLMNLYIVPLTISYEYDPCDYLKAKEFQLKRDIEGYKKTQQDDLMNMITGITGYKGRVHFKAAPCINDELGVIDTSLPKQELFGKISTLIDKHIFRNYCFYPGNYIAYDWLNNSARFVDKYSSEEKTAFEKYIKGQIAKIDIPNKDEAFLLNRLLTMYSNPLVNYLTVCP